jgi:uncharacterized protein (TIGR02996 family)
MITVAEEAFLEAIRAAPEDDAPRLIYADWLEERGDPRGEFIRLQCALARMDRHDPERAALKEREQELLARYRKKWAGPLLRHVARCWFRRGFIEGVEIEARLFLRYTVFLFHAAPLGELRLQKAGPVMRHLVACSALARLRRLDLRNNFLQPRGLQELASCRFLTGLEGLNLDGNVLGTGGVQFLMEQPLIASLKELALGGNSLCNDGATLLAASPHLAKLRRLRLTRNGIGIPGAMDLAASPHLANLELLDVRDNYLGTAGRQALRERFGDRVRM